MRKLIFRKPRAKTRDSGRIRRKFLKFSESKRGSRILLAAGSLFMLTAIGVGFSTDDSIRPKIVCAGEAAPKPKGFDDALVLKQTLDPEKCQVQVCSREGTFGDEECKTASMEELKQAKEKSEMLHLYRSLTMALGILGAITFFFGSNRIIEALSTRLTNAIKKKAKKDLERKGEEE